VPSMDATAAVLIFITFIFSSLLSYVYSTVSGYILHKHLTPLVVELATVCSMSDVDV